MLQRIFITLILALLPLQALADTSTSSTTSGVAQPQSQDAGLGPSTGASTSDGTSLQPAGTSTLQSSNSDSSGLTAPNSSYLQEPASTETNGNLQVLLGNNADGGPEQLPGTGPNYWAWLFFGLLFAFCAAAITWFMRTRSHRSRLMPARAEQPYAVEAQGPSDLPDVGDTDYNPTPTPSPEATDEPKPPDQSQEQSSPKIGEVKEEEKDVADEQSDEQPKASEVPASQSAPTTEASQPPKARKSKQPRRHRH